MITAAALVTETIKLKAKVAQRYLLSYLMYFFSFFAPVHFSRNTRWRNKLVRACFL